MRTRTRATLITLAILALAAVVVGLGGGQLVKTSQGALSQKVLSLPSKVLGHTLLRSPLRTAGKEAAQGTGVIVGSRSASPMAAST